ncbi:MAG: PIG-L family deacetylase [Ruminococcus sp.]|nr:PIG-L family deacetylase [Ruminococcus sp.]
MSVSRSKKKGFWRQGRERMIILGSVLALFVVVTVFGIIKGAAAYNAYKAHTVAPMTIERIRMANVNNADKLMIVAHPDDDVLWGGGHLMEGGWLVVCITNGRNDTRSEEFAKVIEASGNAHLILEYPDKVNAVRDDWTEVIDGIKKDVDMLVTYKNWKMIACHNPKGEYGHQHHKMTSATVTGQCLAHGILGKIRYFGKYYKKDKIDEVKDKLVRITDDQLKFKEYLLTLYKSQSGTIEGLSHMNPYEMWQTYDEYYGESDK